MDSYHTVRERVTTKFSLSLVNELGTPIASSDLATLTVTLYEQMSGAIVNGVNRRSQLNTNEGTVDVNGNFGWLLRPDDNQLISIEKPVEWNRHELYEGIDVGTLTRTGASSEEGLCGSLSAVVRDGRVSFVADANGGVGVGLADKDIETKSDPCYMLYAKTDGTLAIYERGNVIETGQAYTGSSELAIAREGSGIAYYKDATKLRTAQELVLKPLSVVGWITQQGKKASEVTVGQAVACEKHIALIEWTYATGTRRGQHEAMFLVMASENVP